MILGIGNEYQFSWAGQSAAWRAEAWKQGRPRASLGDLRQSERSIFHEFLAAHAAKRRECFRTLLDEAARRAPMALAHLPERIIRIWLWPLQKASTVAIMVGGDLGIKARSAYAGADVSERADLS